MPVEVTQQGKLWCVEVKETLDGLPWVFKETSEDIRTALRVSYGAVKVVITATAILDHPDHDKFKALEREVMSHLRDLPARERNALDGVIDR